MEFDGVQKCRKIVVLVMINPTQFPVPRYGVARSGVQNRSITQNDQTRASLLTGTQEYSREWTALVAPVEGGSERPTGGDPFFF